jgi:hypothetical protein
MNYQEAQSKDVITSTLSSMVISKGLKILLKNLRNKSCIPSLRYFYGVILIFRILLVNRPWKIIKPLGLGIIHVLLD